MSLPADRNTSGLTCIAAYSGRLWYSGASSEVISGDDNSPNLGSFLFFTQIIDTKDKYDKCYQEADPTSEAISDIVDSDGGFVVLSGANRIFKLVAIQNGLLAFAENGIWQVLGGQNGFSATAFSVDKISTLKAISKKSIVVVESNVFFWAKGGIYVLAPSDVTAALRGQNLTDQSIQDFYTSIPASGRREAVGSFDELSREVRWLYSDADTYDGVNERWVYNKELIFNTALSAFHVNTLSNTLTADSVNEGAAAYYVADNEVSTSLDVNIITDNGDNVIDDAANNVTVPSLVATRRGDTATKYLTIYNGATSKEFAFSAYNDSSFKDWGIADAPGKLVTGYDSFGDTQREKKIKDLTLHMQRTENGFALNGDGEIDYDSPSAINITFKFDWAETDNDTQDGATVSGYQLARQYIPDSVDDTFTYPWRVISTKLSPTGSGKVFSMRFDTVEGKDAYILGWGIGGSGDGRA